MMVWGFGRMEMRAEKRWRDEGGVRKFRGPRSGQRRYEMRDMPSLIGMPNRIGPGVFDLRVNLLSSLLASPHNDQDQDK